MAATASLSAPVTDRRVEALEGYTPATAPFGDLLAEGRPFVLKGLVADWPLVRAGAQGLDAAMAYLLRFYEGKRVVGYTGPPEIGGRYFYHQGMTALNFSAERVLLDEYLALIARYRDDANPPSFYVGSTDLDTYLPGLRGENPLLLGDAMFDGTTPVVSIWMGNHTIASAHYDMSNNIACCAVGRRRFTLFPPDQVANLYPGPLEPTPGGQVVSTVNFDAPDFDRYPRFRDALAMAQVAELEAGDALIYPALWWHQVEAFGPLNAMINTWWNSGPPFLDTPMNTLLHGLLSLRDRPEAEKTAWRAMFDYYVFGPADRAGAHLPEPARGALAAPMDPVEARRLRAMLLNKLNR